MASKNQMDDQFARLEEAHLKYLEAAQIDLNNNQMEAIYLDEPSQDWEEACRMYGEYVKTRKQLELST